MMLHLTKTVKNNNSGVVTVGTSQQNSSPV